MDEISYPTDKQLKTSVHGVYMSIFGIGVLLIGKSGVGKSETAIELVFRGHKFVADDAVNFYERKNRIIGESPVVIKNLMEIRGVGIIDVKDLYGRAAICNKKRLSLVIELEKWVDDKEYTRVEMLEYRYPLLGHKVPKVIVPVDAGRNLAIVIEVAVKNFMNNRKGNRVKNLIERRRKESI